MNDDRAEVVLSAFGVTVQVVVEEAQLLPSVLAVLPPGWEHGDPADVVARFELAANGDLVRDGTPAGTAAGLGGLGSGPRAVVARGGRALVRPGPSLSGKTTLVAALVRSGAAYLSDEFAVLDPEGRVHPY